VDPTDIAGVPRVMVGSRRLIRSDACCCGASVADGHCSASNLPVVLGLDAFVAGSVLYAILGTKRSLAVGADSTIAPVLAVGVASVVAAGTSGSSVEHG
jgi:hypothetical protein